METTTDTRGIVHPVYGPGFHTKGGGVPLSIGGKRVAGASVPLRRSGAPAAITPPAVKAVRFRELTASEVSPPLAAAAAAVLAKVAALLDLKGLHVQWFCSEHELDREERLRHKAATGTEPWYSWQAQGTDLLCSGFFHVQRDTIYVKSSRDVWQVVRTVAHEARHAWQQRHTPTMSDDEREKDAEAFAAKAVAAYRTGTGTGTGSGSSSPPPAGRVPMPFYAP